MVKITFKDNSDKLKNFVSEQLEEALDANRLLAENYAKSNLKPSIRFNASTASIRLEKSDIKKL